MVMETRYTCTRCGNEVSEPSGSLIRSWCRNCEDYVISRTIEIIQDNTQPVDHVRW
jgi:DNA-directed RNA polymerase subunit RPC12/RpoP